MRELVTSLVFEVDHADSQQQKLQRVASLTRVAREVRFVPVDFRRGDLAHALEAAGHDPHLPTAWLWEGVVMYLDRDEIKTTLRILEDRSAPGSRLIVAYHQPAWMLLLLAVICGLALHGHSAAICSRLLFGELCCTSVRTDSIEKINHTVYVLRR